MLNPKDSWLFLVPDTSVRITLVSMFSVLKRNVAEAVATKAYFMSYDFSTGCYLGSLLNLYYSQMGSRVVGLVY